MIQGQLSQRVMRCVHWWCILCFVCAISFQSVEYIMAKIGVIAPGFSSFPIWSEWRMKLRKIGEEAAIESWVESWEIFSSSLDHASKTLYPSSSSWTSTASWLNITLVTVPIEDYISKVRTILPRTRCCGGHVYPKHGKWRLHVGCVSQCPFTVPIDMVTRTCLLLYVYIYIYTYTLKHIWGHEDPLTNLAVILGFLRMACMD